MDKARKELKASRNRSSGEGPMEDEHGNRKHSAAAEHLTETFGGLVLGFTGSPPPTPPGEMSYRGLMFSTGNNLGPDYPDDMRMTPYCTPQGPEGTLHLRDTIADKRQPVRAHFSPTPSTVEAVGKEGPSGSAPGPVEPPKKRVISVDEEEAGEDFYTAPTPRSNARDNNLLIFFGKSEEIRRNECPPIFTTSEDNVLDYMDAHNIEIFLEHLLTLCSLNLPG